MLKGGKHITTSLEATVVCSYGGVKHPIIFIKFSVKDKINYATISRSLGLVTYGTRADVAKITEHISQLGLQQKYRATWARPRSFGPIANWLDERKPKVVSEIQIGHRRRQPKAEELLKIEEILKENQYSTKHIFFA